MKKKPGILKNRCLESTRCCGSYREFLNIAVLSSRASSLPEPWHGTALSLPVHPPACMHCHLDEQLKKGLQTNTSLVFGHMNRKHLHRYSVTTSIFSLPGYPQVCMHDHLHEHLKIFWSLEGPRRPPLALWERNWKTGDSQKKGAWKVHGVAAAIENFWFLRFYHHAIHVYRVSVMTVTSPTSVSTSMYALTS